MFKRQLFATRSDLYCSKTVDNLKSEEFHYYDKDGFELNQAEQKFYSAMHYPIDHNILNHRCWQEPWYLLDDQTQGIMLDHCMILYRCCYIGDAKQQLSLLKPSIPQVDFLLNTRIKWGFDFALDGIAPDDSAFEVLHIEYDSTDYQTFSSRMVSFEFAIKHTDWQDAAQRVWQCRDEWQHLKGFEQNHWKAKYLIGWERAEVIEKAN